MMTCGFILSFPYVAQSQEPTPRFEIGGHYAFLDFAEGVGFHVGASGVGARFTYNLDKYVASEAEVDYFQDRIFGFSDFGRKTLVVFGVKAGFRKKRFGVFGKARPGFIHFNKAPGTVCPLTMGFQGIPCPVAAKTDFAMDFGGVFEYYASRKVAIRFDAGDTIIRHQRIFGTTHQFQSTAGVVFRF